MVKAEPAAFTPPMPVINLPVISLCGADSSATMQLLRLPWSRQLELLGDNERCDLPGFERDSQPAKNLLWLLLGYDPDCQQYPSSQHFNAEASKLFVQLCATYLLTVCSTMCYLFAENYGRRRHSLTQTRGKKPANAWCACRTCWQRMRPRTSCPRSGREHIITLMSSGSSFF